LSLLLAALGRAHVEIGRDDGDGGEASPWPVSVGALSSGTRGGVSTLRRHCVCAAALVAWVACRDAAAIDGAAEVD
jgi:hypothetical protein